MKKFIDFMLRRISCFPQTALEKNFVYLMDAEKLSFPGKKFSIHFD
jgi:hypothetical protein